MLGAPGMRSWARGKREVRLVSPAVQEIHHLPDLVVVTHHLMKVIWDKTQGRFVV